MRSLKTVQIDSEMGWSGGQRQVAGLCRYLRTQGHDVTLICRPGSELHSWAAYEGLPAFGAAMRSILSWTAVLRMRALIRRERPDVVHLHASRAHVLGGAAAKLAGARVVVVTRRMDEPVKMIWPNTSAYGRWSTAIVAISAAVRDVLVECGVAPEKIRIIESGVDVDRFASADPDPAILDCVGAPADTPLVTVAAALVERKGIRYLIEAAALLAGNGQAFRLVVAGDGELRGELEELARELGAPVSFVGFWPDMPRLMVSSDLFVMPSLKEGLGVAVMEAMAAGKPVVASAVGGLRESVIDGETGLLVPPRDPVALADAIKRLLTDPAFARRLGEAGQARARAHYSLENMAARNEALYSELLDM